MRFMIDALTGAHIQRSVVLWDPLLKATARLSSWVFILLFCCSRGVWTLLLSIYRYDSEQSCRMAGCFCRAVSRRRVRVLWELCPELWRRLGLGGTYVSDGPDFDSGVDIAM